MSTLMALNPMYDLMKNSINLQIDNETNKNVIDKHCNGTTHVTEIDLRQIAKDQERVHLLHNCWLVHKIARATESPYLESWEGTFHASQKLWYLSTHR